MNQCKGTLKSNKSLFIDPAVSYVTAVFEGKQYQTFGIRPIEGGTIRPGDDFFIGIELENNSGIKAYDKETFVAVYDKKMLWRANLYIDESSEKQDWNNLHPWNSQENEWNRYHDGNKTFLGLSDLPWAETEQVEYNGKTSTIVPGGQVINFAQWTPIRGNKEYFKDRVAYDYPYSWAKDKPLGGPNPFREDRLQGMDSPFDFNKKLVRYRDQLKAIGQKILEGQGIDEETAISGQGVTSTVGQLSDLDSTRAPGDAWLNYWVNPANYMTQFNALNIERVYVPQIGLYYLAQKAPLEDDYELFNGNGIAGRKAYPAENAEGLTTILGKGNTIYIKKNGYADYSFSSTQQNGYVAMDQIFRPSKQDGKIDVFGSGTDCIGFAQRSATYDGNPYLWSNLARDEAEDASEIGANPWNRVFPRDLNDATGDRTQYSDVVVSRDIYISEDDDSDDTLRRIVPGDILYYHWHIAVVQSVEYDDEGKARPETIMLIESTWGEDMPNVGSFANVTAHRSLKYYHDAGKNWRIVRLK